ncbi:MAG: hypothetical protein PHC88_09340 [Terrimicrobiaceae bacterium]|nr:hypothetical protein [Terrimicrobiaceae bacterium]
MIPLTLSQIVAAYAAGPVVALLLLSLGGAWSRARRASRARRRRIQCAHCGTIYENFSPEPLPRCPNCVQPNERTAPSSV